MAVVKKQKETLQSKVRAIKENVTLFVSYFERKELFGGKVFDITFKDRNDNKFIVKGICIFNDNNLDILDTDDEVEFEPLTIKYTKTIIMNDEGEELVFNTLSSTTMKNLGFEVTSRNDVYREEIKNMNKAIKDTETKVLWEGKK